MRAPFVLLICLLFHLVSCSWLAKTVHHAKTPKTENAATITAWLEKENIHVQNIATIEPGRFYRAMLLYGKGPMLFNRKGDFISVGYNDDTKFCPKGVDEFLKGLYPGFERGDAHLSNYIVDENSQDTIFPSINEVLSVSKDLHGNLIPTPVLPQNHYTLTIPFMVYMGNTIQTRDIRKYLSAIKQNSSARIDVLLINFDKQEWWGEEWNKKIRIRI